MKNKNKIKISVIGLGYVGLPLARLLATKYPVIAVGLRSSTYLSWCGVLLRGFS